VPIPFLTANWNNLFLATYAVPPALLEPRLPPGLALDVRGGRAFVSLVAFEFLDTRVLGVPWPGYRNFAELNLRFYVRHGTDRGVVFVREFVPQRLVAWMARRLYNEPYLAAQLTSHRQDDDRARTLEYRLTFAGRQHRIRVTGDKPAFLPGDATDEHFFKEHHWGFGSTRRGRTLRYKVEHPVWEVLPVRSYEIDLDWAAVYGAEWGFLGKAVPCSTVFAVGSPIRVYPKGQPVACRADEFSAQRAGS
jgi:uncharacterized protein YqjF (DUF2071 family)